MMFGYGSHWGIWQVAMGSVGMIAFAALLIWAVYAMTTSSNRPSEPHPSLGGGGDPGAILDVRLARGEITVEEHRHLREVMGSDNQRPPVGSAK